MEEGHWAVVLWVMVFLAVLLFVVLHIRLQKRLHRLMQRAFWAFFAVWLGSTAGWMGLNLFTLSFTACFGLPGMAALMVIAGM